MKKQKFLFDVSERYGGDPHGQLHFIMDSFKLMLEDDEFFNDNIKLVTPNNYSHLDYAFEVSICMLEAYEKTNTRPSIEVVRGIINAKYGDGTAFKAQSIQEAKEWEKRNITALEANKFLDEIEERELDANRVKEVKTYFKFYNMYVYFVGLGNYILDSAKDGLTCNRESFLHKIEETFERCDTLCDAYMSYKRTYDENGNKNNSAEDW